MTKRRISELRAAEARARGESVESIATRWGLGVDEVREFAERGLPELGDLVGTDLSLFLRRTLFAFLVLARDAQLEYERAETSIERQAALRLRSKALADIADFAVRSGLLPRVDVWGAPEAAERALAARATLEDDLAEIVRDPETPDPVRERVRRALANFDADTAELLQSLREVSGVH